MKGLIPARAGKTSTPRLGPATGKAHPRAGGENRKASVQSTRTRWLIPARAGKTARCDGASSPNAAHPRAGGENGFCVCA